MSILRVGSIAVPASLLVAIAGVSGAEQAKSIDESLVDERYEEISPAEYNYLVGWVDGSKSVVQGAIEPKFPKYKFITHTVCTDEPPAVLEGRGPLRYTTQAGRDYLAGVIDQGDHGPVPTLQLRWLFKPCGEAQNQ